MTENGSVTALDAWSLSLHHEEQCRYFGKRALSAVSASLPTSSAYLRRAHTFCYGAWYFCSVSARVRAACWPWINALTADVGESDHRHWILRSHAVLEQKTACVSTESAYWWHSWKRISRQTSSPTNPSMILAKAKLDLQALISIWAQTLRVSILCEMTWNFLWLTVRRH